MKKFKNKKEHSLFEKDYVNQYKETIVIFNKKGKDQPAELGCGVCLACAKKFGMFSLIYPL